MCLEYLVHLVLRIRPPEIFPGQSSERVVGGGFAVRPVDDPALPIPLVLVLIRQVGRQHGVLYPLWQTEPVQPHGLDVKLDVVVYQFLTLQSAPYVLQTVEREIAALSMAKRQIGGPDFRVVDSDAADPVALPNV